MRPNAQNLPHTYDIFRSQLTQIINMKHELVCLSKAIDWKYLEERNAEFYKEEGRPGVTARLMIGLHLLKYMFNLSDEGVCERWVYDPYFQFFCGEEYFQHKLDMERSSMTHWRKRVGEKFLENLVQESLHSAFRLGALETKNMERVAVDTTVQPKAVTFPTDAKLYYKAIVSLGKLAKQEGLELRQSYVRVAKRTLVKVGRYRHAKQMKRAKKSEKKLKTYLGRIIRDIERKVDGNEPLREKFFTSLYKANRILNQKKDDKEKIYSWHAPEVECIAKGKANKPYEFGCKVSLITNINPAPAGHFVLHTAALHGRPFDGHTLRPMLEAMQAWTGIDPKRIYVDRGYQGHDYPKKLRVFKSGQKRGVTKAIKKELKRRSVIEPIIGHVKHEHRLGRNYLQGWLGDKANALFAAAGYNFRLILNWLRDLFLLIFVWIFAGLKRPRFQFGF
jgi:transposase, IS5 family